MEKAKVDLEHSIQAEAKVTNEVGTYAKMVFR